MADATTTTTTAADIAAAVALGVLPEATAVVTAQEAQEATRAAVAAALAETVTPVTPAFVPDVDPVATADHHCSQRGCRHGAHTTGQPDRQVKLAAPCGAILRMTPRALARAGGEVRCGHGDPFAVDATRRAYSRKA